MRTLNAQEQFIRVVNYKVDLHKNHPRYEWFRSKVDMWLRMRSFGNLDGISADVYLQLFILRTYHETEAWLNDESAMGFTEEEQQDTWKHVNLEVSRIHEQLGSLGCYSPGDVVRITFEQGSIYNNHLGVCTDEFLDLFGDVCMFVAFCDPKPIHHSDGSPVVRDAFKVWEIEKA